ncbi:MAG: formate C-acetyltransferase/glycerol dehydratase family glycyl radical enzyme [Candidatus Lokiarchaeota archaeon]|nr:formate C-acetyltransferase/glycerol dehydratase family glycyl radical enzyme [Candidatus Lokiarchaeota archaeon]
MSERVKKLRKLSTTTAPYICTERSELLTKFYQEESVDLLSTPVARARAFKYILEHKTIYIGDGELIVGERGSAPRATPTYPELCCHTVEDLDVASSRERTPFHVSDQARETYRHIVIPFWQGHTMREKVFEGMSKDWKAAFESGVFTEFMEQRAPGHAILDDKIYRYGLIHFKKRIQKRLKELEQETKSEAKQKREELKAMNITADALIIFAKRHAKKALELAKVEQDKARKNELERIAEICNHVPEHSPRNFWEALQMYWFVHLGVTIELNVWDSLNPGRLDQNLFPFFESDLEEGVLNREFAQELLGCFWVKFNNQPAPPKVDITEQQSGTYQDFALINVGGLTPEAEDGVNELSYMILDVLEEMRLIMPSVCVQVSEKNPDIFLRRAIEVIKQGFGQPSVFNTDVILQEFLRAGKSMEDALNGGPSGCVTISAFGKESCILTGYCNWPKILEITLNNGVDIRTGKMVGIQTGDPHEFQTFSDLIEAYRKQLEYFVNLKIEGNNIIERLYATYMPAPFMSLLFDDCIEKGKDYHNGGPRYNSTYIQGVGLGTLADSLVALKYHVFDKKSISLTEFVSALKTNFSNHEVLRQKLLQKTPKYGNDDDYADCIAVEAFNAYFDVVDGKPNTKGGEYRVNLLPTTVHIYFGEVTGATPNGRVSGQPLSDGISPSPGADTMGPTAVVKSVAKMDHTKTGGTLLNQKLMPDLLIREEGRLKLLHLIRGFFKMGGHHIQFNVIDTETLVDAQQNPSQYCDLIVRVAGYSDYFVNIGPDLQDEIIGRTLQKRF